MVTEWLRPRASLCSSERLFSSWTLEGPLISCKCLLENALTFHVNGKTLFNRLSFIALQVSGHYTHHRGPLNLVWYYLRKKSLIPSHYVRKFGLGVRGINPRPEAAENMVVKLRVGRTRMSGFVEYLDFKCMQELNFWGKMYTLRKKIFEDLFLPEKIG